MGKVQCHGRSRRTAASQQVRSFENRKMIINRARMIRSMLFSVLLLELGALSLIFHFMIYRHTSASAFVNQPVFYYNRFYIRESNGQTRDVSLQVGFWSYITAGLSVGSLCWGGTRVIVARKMRRRANQLL